MFTVEMLPAGRGDCLWVEYGDPQNPHRLLIDGGIPSTATDLRRRIEQLPKNARRFELVVVTHIDLDHIGGLLGLLRIPPEGFQADDVWFNSWTHLPGDPGILGAKDAERLTFILKEKDYVWNKAFGGRAVAMASPEELPAITLGGGMRVTLLSPTLKRLAELRPVWEEVIVQAGLEPGTAGYDLEGKKDSGLLGESAMDLDRLAMSMFTTDDSEANGSSIAFLAEHDGKRCLLAGDAFAPDLASSLDFLARDNAETRVVLDAFKISHHGGRRNTSCELLQQIACSQYLFSTDGSQHHHPHAEVVARVTAHGNHGGLPRLCFNYRNDRTNVWDDRVLYHGKYEPVFPQNASGLKVHL